MSRSGICLVVSVSDGRIVISLASSLASFVSGHTLEVTGGAGI